MIGLLLITSACANTECGVRGYKWGYTITMMKTGNPYKAHAAALYMQEAGDAYCKGQSNDRSYSGDYYPGSDQSD